MPRRISEVCSHCHKNWFACTCGTRFEWEGVEEPEGETEEEDEDAVETIADFDADELGIDPEHEGEQ